MSPMQITTEPTTKARKPQSYYDRKARQARSDFLAETFHALRGSILEALANRMAIHGSVRKWSWENRPRLLNPGRSDPA